MDCGSFHPLYSCMWDCVALYYSTWEDASTVSHAVLYLSRDVFLFSYCISMELSSIYLPLYKWAFSSCEGFMLDTNPVTSCFSLSPFVLTGAWLCQKPAVCPACHVLKGLCCLWFLSPATWEHRDEGNQALQSSSLYCSLTATFIMEGNMFPSEDICCSHTVQALRKPFATEAQWLSG